ncbi:MAG: type II toxin-antitoxin system VapC family toxin [Actinomycetota bacterium]|nr:type II toxin-antitoxin system VapC family toxin [Actinomycetota bacterium]
MDSSGLLKRVFAESDSPAAVSLLRSHVDAGDTLAASSLAWVEVSRVVLGRIAGGVPRPDEAKTVGKEAIRSSNADALIEIALSGLVEKPMSPDVIALARRLRPTVLRSLDAIHLSSALLLDSDRMVTYDQRLADAAGYHGIQVEAP